MTLTVVLVHPFPLSPKAFASDVAALASEELRFVTPAVHAASIDAMADDVAGELDRLGVDRAVVGGLSMGGYVALAFARRHPGRLRGLVLADTRAEPDSAEAREGRETGIAKIASGDVAGFLEGLLPKLTVKPNAAVRELAAKANPEWLVTTLRALRDRPDARPGLAAIAVPTLVLVGTGDTVTPPAAAKVLHEGIRGSSLVAIPDAGHLANVDNPEAFRSALAEFLRPL